MKIKINHPDGRSKIVTVSQWLTKPVQGLQGIWQVQTDEGTYTKDEKGVFRHNLFPGYTAEFIPPQFD